MNVENDPLPVLRKLVKSLSADLSATAYRLRYEAVVDRLCQGIALPTDQELLADLANYGVHIQRDGDRVAPEDFYSGGKNPETPGATALTTTGKV